MATAIIGTGTWGTATAFLCSRQDLQDPILLWGRDQTKVAAMRRSRGHDRLPGLQLPERVQITAEAADLHGADLVLWAVPTQYTRKTLAGLAEVLPGRPIISLSKGLEQDSLFRVTQIFADVLGPGDYGVLSGPSHAEEAVAGLPTALVVAGSEPLRQAVVDRLHGGNVRIYTAADHVGVEIGGAMKNVIAIAAGIADGLQLGDNAKAALITRGVAEMRRLGRALGSEDATFAGLAGIGDLLATCYSPFGRNRALGLAIAEGMTVDEHLATTGMVAEGAWTSRAAVALGSRHGCELPIASQVASMVWDGTPVEQAITALLTRSAKEEDA